MSASRGLYQACLIEDAVAVEKPQSVTHPRFS